MKKNIQKKNKNKLPFLFLIFPVLLFILCDTFLLYALIMGSANREKALPNPFTSFSAPSYPYITEKSFKNLYVSAKAVAVLDNRSKTVLFAKNANLRFAPASTTKIATAIVSLNYYKLNDILEVKRPYVEGSKVGFTQGEDVTFKNLLYGMLLPSGNDAAYAMADNYKGGDVNFIRSLNEEVSKLNLYNTHFSDPAGIDDDGDYTTAFDLARLAAYAMQNKEFARVVDTPYSLISDITNTYVYPIYNLNKLLGRDGVYGIKTGTTDEAEQVLVLCKSYRGHRVIIVIMGSEDRFLDARNILSALDGNITYLSMHP